MRSAPRTLLEITDRDPEGRAALRRTTRAIYADLIRAAASRGDIAGEARLTGALTRLEEEWRARGGGE